jgi:hypothetical protein
MREKLSLIFLGVLLMAATGCKKCYYCQNSCKVCQDPHYYILVQSDILSAKYYKLYTDSLVGLGWTCRDTTSNRDKQVCGEDNHISGDILMQTEAGWTCTEVQ